MSRFKHSITLKGIPKHIFDNEHPDHTIMDWLYENVGTADIFNLYPDGVWDRDTLKYSSNGHDIVLTYNFEREEDALYFALRWAN